MSNLDKIVGRILQSGRDEADAITKEAQKKSQQIIDDARALADEEYRRIQESAYRKVLAINEGAKTSSQQYLRQKSLSAKQNMIEKVFETALEKLHNLDDVKYFSVIYGMIGKYMHKGEKGYILFSGRDAARLPADFKKKLEEISSSGLELSEETRNIDGGFILVYGGIEENCSFSRILDSQREELSDKIVQVLFPKEKV